MDELRQEMTMKIACNLMMAIKKRNIGKSKEEKITQSKLAEMSGVARSTISRIENGMFMPDLITLVCIARALDVELADLLDGIK